MQIDKTKKRKKGEEDAERVMKKSFHFPNWKARANIHSALFKISLQQ